MGPRKVCPRHIPRMRGPRCVPAKSPRGLVGSRTRLAPVPVYFRTRGGLELLVAGAVYPC